jgi:hypothetical protein
MMHRYVAALALVGWYLMLPPFQSGWFFIVQYGAGYTRTNFPMAHYRQFRPRSHMLLGAWAIQKSTTWPADIPAANF